MDLVNLVKKEMAKLNINDDQVLVVAVSGGPDSVALLHILAQLGYKLHVAHLNHGLRGKESEEDAEFVKSIAQNLILPYTIEKRSIPQQGSIQQQARKIRYQFFKEVCQSQGSDILVLAQHCDDQLETVLMNFFRGAGLAGLTGIKSINNYDGITLVRPLLKCSKEEILNYLKENNIKYRIDSSNLKEKYLRNKFRLKIIPFLEKELGSGFKRTILGNVEILNLDEDYLNQQTEQVLSAVIKKRDKYSQYDIILDAKLGTYHKAIIARVIRRIISDLYDLRNFSSQNILDIIDVCASPVPKTIHLPNKILFTKWSNNLAFFREENVKFKGDEITVYPEQPVIYGNKRIIIKEELDEDLGKANHIISGDNLSFPLVIRGRKNGDRIRLSQSGGRKKIKDFFIDLKIPKQERDNIPILTDSEDNVIAILGYRVSYNYYIKKDTCKKLYVYINENGGI
ncbi:tRNA lysidine(34) synthetase TilS [Anaerobranca gottschalkii]|uniref:tRNA(Ile)-lysidine synthase n=1 Tax=Anaerobranca gottschalkii DSM 13577 TaxID=1120990 RepID=A0A1I0AW78_9FIRM|nr:tRNA lysidine(34) synthetase TilS [Anaerobranca gottschalkii]SES98695.1 tRNA(Ile)-lysidine synthase [Anaerobranca gottschalkii DSM 13577]